jgi:prepilin-type N-terminal cleavage/methylation domain-containing protein
MKKRKGFTLIEILIVVVILAVLATLVLPRMLAQPENALVAEANQQLGSLARAQDTSMQLTGNATGIAFASPGTAAEWASLGLQAPTGGRFTYACTTTTCTATRATGGTITINYTLNPKTYACTAPYTIGTDTTRGCSRV